MCVSTKSSSRWPDHWLYDTAKFWMCLVFFCKCDTHPFRENTFKISVYSNTGCLMHAVKGTVVKIMENQNVCVPMKSSSWWPDHCMIPAKFWICLVFLCKCDTHAFGASTPKLMDRMFHAVQQGYNYSTDHVPSPPKLKLWSYITFLLYIYFFLLCLLTVISKPRPVPCCSLSKYLHVLS